MLAVIVSLLVSWLSSDCLLPPRMPLSRHSDRHTPNRNLFSCPFLPPFCVSFRNDLSRQFFLSVNLELCVEVSPSPGTASPVNCLAQMGSYDGIPDINMRWPLPWDIDLASPVNCLAQMGSLTGFPTLKSGAVWGRDHTNDKTPLCS